MTNPGPVTRFIRRVFGLDFIDPSVGQRWLSTHSCKAIEVVQVRVTDGGSVWVEVIPALHGSPPPISSTFCTDLHQWRLRLREERRVLIHDPNA